MSVIRVLIVDDSALVRQVLNELLSEEEGIRVIATARDPIVAMDQIKRERPDVITLDLEMPRMDGLEFLAHLMASDPIPVVVCSSLTAAGSETAIRALEAGAVDIVTKPRIGTKQFLEESRTRIATAIRAAACADPRKVRPVYRTPAPALKADAVLGMRTTDALTITTDRVIVVGASTGGTEAIRVFLEAMPSDCPGIVIVQHMPEHFTRAFADRLDRLCRVSVKECVSRDVVLRGRALIAPGNKHTVVKRSGAQYFVEVLDGELVNRHRPSVDVLFRSAARWVGRNAIGVIMTGMGDDGADGMLEMHGAGAITFAQDKESCVVFGMPKEAIARGGVTRVAPLESLAHEALTAAR